MQEKHNKNIWKDENLKSNEKLVLLYLIDYYNTKDNYCYKTREQIQRETGISKNTLSKVLNSLEDKGYIIRAKKPNKSGKNNIYYINKYLVTNKNNNMSSPEPQIEVSDNQSTNNSNDNVKSDIQPLNNSVEKSANEKLLNDVGIHKLTNEQLERLNKLDTDKLIKTIEIAKQNSNNINFNYLMAIYNNKNTYEEPHKNNKGQVVKGAYQQKFTNSKAVTTKYHGTFNEHFRKYSEEELEKKLHKMQNDKALNKVKTNKENENNVGDKSSSILKKFDIENSELPPYILEQMKLYQVS